MTLPPSSAWNASNVHEARTALGKRLRELRSSAGISGRRLAESLSWPPSKVSKLENGRQTPTDDDIRDWARVTGSVAETEALLASLHTLEVQHAEWQRVMRTGLKPRQPLVPPTCRLANVTHCHNSRNLRVRSSHRER